MFNLTGDVAVVTGGGGGLGRQFALALAKQGAKVAVIARRKNLLDETVSLIEEAGSEGFAVACDVTDEAQITAAKDAILEKFGKIDILVNNAGGGTNIKITDMTEDTCRSITKLDIDGTFFCNKIFGKVMCDAGYGRIINIASILGVNGLKEIPIGPYAASKGAVVNFTRQAAAEMAPYGVNVNALAPGFFASEANDPEAMKAMDDMIRFHTILCRPGEPGELDSTVVYLAAHESSYVTGAYIPCDGGWTAI